MEYTILNADGKSVRSVSARKVHLECLPELDFIGYKEPGQSYWIVAEVSSGCRVSHPKGYLNQAIKSAEERIHLAGISQTRALIAEKAPAFAALCERVRLNLYA